LLADEATLPPTHPAARLVGGQPLTPEESVNFSAGTVLQWGSVDITIDYFRIELEDRIARSSEKILTPENVATLLAQGVADASSFTSVRFYTNDFDTTTQGLDIVANWSTEAFGGTSTVRLAANWTDTTVDSRDPAVINDKRVVQIEENTPAKRFSLSWNHVQGPIEFLVRARWYDEFVEFSTDDATARLDADARTLVDVELAYALSDAVRVMVGAENVLDETPTRQYRNVSGLLYAETSPYGANGGFYYARAVWTP